MRLLPDFPLTWRGLARGAAAAWVAVLALLLATPARAENVYVMDINLTGIYSVDLTTGGPATLLTSIQPPSNPQGYTLAVRPSDGMLFYLDTNGTNPNLWRWNPATPTVPPVLVGTPGAATTGVVRLGFDGGNNLLAMDTTANIWTLDQSTGGILSTTPLSGDKPTQSGDLCLNTSTGVLYMVANHEVYTVTAPPLGGSTLLGTITNLPNGGTTNGLVTGCAFTHNGTLVISMYGGGALRTVNLTSLASTALPTSTGIASIGDLATAPSRMADLRVAQTASTTTPGTNVSFTVTVTNDGPQSSNTVRVLDALPAGLTFVSATPSQGSYSTAAVGVIPASTWQVGALQAGQSATLTINATVTAAAPITNTAQVSYSDEYDPDSTPNNSVAGEDDQASVTITPSADLRLTKAATSSFSVGVPGTYTIKVNNAGPAPTAGTYTVTDVLPAGLTYQSAAGLNWACSNAAGTVTCSSSTVIAANGSNPNAITLTVLPAVAAAPQVTNTASVAGGGEPANNAGDNTGTVTTAVCNSNCPDLRVNKTVSASPLTVGTAATYTLSVTNIGGLTTGATAYTVLDTLPTGITVSSSAPAGGMGTGNGWTIGAGWTCAPSSPDNVANGSVVSCTGSTAVTPGTTSTTIVFPVTVANTAVPQVVNTATVSGGGEPPATQGNNSSSLTTPVVDFDFAVSKAKSTAGNFAVGTASGYVFTVTNVGGRASTGSYFFTDTLPAGLTINANAPATGTGTGSGWTIGAGWTCKPNVPQAGDNTTTGRIYCTSSTAVTAGTSAATVTVPVAVAGAAAPSVTNTVTVGAALEAAALQGNNSFDLTTPVDAVDLTITKSHNGSLAVGTTTAYTLTVSNIGDVGTSGTITVVDTLPASLTYVSTTGTGAGWTCGYASPNVTCTRTTAIAANNSAPPIVINVTPTAGGNVVNTAIVSGGNEPGGNGGNNTANDPTVVYFPPVIAKSFSPASITVGGTSTMTFTITNPAGSGLAAITGLSFTDPFPAGMSVATVPNLVNTCGGAVSPGTSQGDTTLALSGGSTGGPGTSCTVSVSVTGTTTGAKNNVTSQVSSTNSGTGNTASATLTVNAPASGAVLTKLSSPGVVGVGEIATLTFTITNGAGANNNMAFTDTFNANVQVAGAATTTCTTNNNGGAAVVTATAGTSVVKVTGLDLNGNASCTVTVPIKGTAVGSYANTSANISAVAGTLSTASVNDVLDVQAATLTKTFSPTTVLVNANSTVSFVITNGSGQPEINGIGFTETLPTNLVLAAAPTASQCGGTVAGAANGPTVTVSGATLAAGQASCTITAVVKSGTPGTYVNGASNVSAVTTNLVKNVNATLTVNQNPALIPSITKTDNQTTITPGDSTTYVITVTNTTGGATAVVFKDPAVANLTINSVTCAAQSGASCPALTSAQMITNMQGGTGLAIPSMPNNGAVVFNVNATLTGNPSGTITNSATATANGGTNQADDTDTIVYPGLLHTKTVAVLNDPVNGTSNPKNIPGAEVLYTITVANTGEGRVDTDTLVLTDAVPANTSLFVGNLGGSPAGPVTYADAAGGLTFGFTSLASTTDDLEFSNNNASTWTYTPVADASGYDATVTNIRLKPKGRMAGWSGSGAFPSFTFTFKVRVR